MEVSVAVVQAGQVDQLDGVVLGGGGAEFIGEPGAAEEQQADWAGPGRGTPGGSARGGEQVTDVGEAAELTEVQDVAPLGLTDGEQAVRRRTIGVFRARAPGSSSRWMIDGRAGEAFAKKGNSSRTTVVGPAAAIRRSRPIASSQDSNRSGVGSSRNRASAAPNWRSESPSVVSVAVNMKPLVARATASRRNVFPCRRRPETTPNVGSRPS